MEKLENKVKIVFVFFKKKATGKKEWKATEEDS